MRVRSCFLLALLSISSLVACEGETTPPITVDRSPVSRPTGGRGPVIGLVGTMSGPESWRGTDAFEGADLARQALNAGLEPSDEPFELVTLDDRGEAARAAGLVADLAEDPRTVGVIYAGPLEGILGAREALAEHGLPAIVCYGDLYSSRQLGPELFQASPPYLWQARRLVSYLASDRGYRRIGLLARGGADGDAAVASFRAEVGRGERTSLQVQRYDDEAGVEADLGALRRARTEAVIVHGSPATFARTLEILESQDASYRSTKEARQAKRGQEWRPQVAGLDGVFDPAVQTVPKAGTVVSESYARGAHYLPVPSFVKFREAFQRWWGAAPLGAELRAFDAAHMLGWAARRRTGSEPLARTLERLSGARWGGLDVSFGPDDHTVLDAVSVGIWTAPHPAAMVKERRQLPASLPWVPLARGFSTNGRRTDIPRKDWPFLFTGRFPPGSPGPAPSRSIWGVDSGGKDPVH